MSFHLPNFNLFADVYHAPWVVPPGRGPDAVFPCNLTPGRRQQAALWTPSGATDQSSRTYALFPPSVDVRDKVNVGGGDLVQIPSGSGVFYQVVSVHDVAKGFSNEYRVAVLQKVATPTPMP